MNRRNVSPYKVDYAKETIIITKDFAKRANVVGSPEFDCLAELLRAYPRFKVTARTARKCPARPSVKGLTNAFMETHIRTIHPLDVELYQHQLEVSKAFKCPHMYMRKWFIARYPNWADYIVQNDNAANA